MQPFFDAIASPATEQDRLRFLVGAQPKDSDEDLSEDEGKDSFSDQLKDDKKGRTKDEDVEDVDKAILDELDEETDEKDEKDDTSEKDEVDERDADLEDEELTYKKRFADTKADRDEKVRMLRESMAENARLKALQAASADVNEEALAKEIQDGIYQEVSLITETDPKKRTKAAYDVVGKHIAMATKKAVDLALSKVNLQRQTEAQQSTEHTQKREAAAKRAKIALRESGLDPEKTFALFQKEVDRQMETEPEWFEAVPASEHFMRLASRVKDRLERNKKANDEHRREAGGQLNAGSRVTRSAKSKDEDEGEPDTMRGAMSLANKANHLRGRKAFQLAHLR